MCNKQITSEAVYSIRDLTDLKTILPDLRPLRLLIIKSHEPSVEHPASCTSGKCRGKQLRDFTRLASFTQEHRTHLEFHDTLTSYCGETRRNRLKFRTDTNNRIRKTPAPFIYSRYTPQIPVFIFYYDHTNPCDTPLLGFPVVSRTKQLPQASYLER